jgi:shikimate dehydrogenase
MTDRYAVIGHPVEHSLSPRIHAAFARACGHDIAYDRIAAPRDGFRAAALAFRDAGGKGLNVTLPFKHEAWALAERHSDYARGAGAVNTLVFAGGAIAGHNTDGIGLARDLRDNLACPVAGRRVLLMGAGGAVYGVVEALLRERPRSLFVANRTPDKAQALVAHFAALHALADGGVGAGPYAGLGGRFDLVINATSAGLGDAMPALPADALEPGALAYDMVYGRVTPFMKFAAAHGARAVDGLGMLVEQAAESFFIWRGVHPATKPVIDELRRDGEGRRANGEGKGA